MKRYLFLLFTSTVVSIQTYAHKSPGIAVYNVDSVLITMPEYEAVLQVYTKFDSVLNLQISQIETEYLRKIAEFNNDSVKWSPLIRELKRKEINDLRERMREFRQQTFDEREERKKRLREPLEKKIAEAAAVIGKEKGFLAVIRNEGYVDSRRIRYFGDWDTFKPPGPSLLNEAILQPITYLDPKIKTINITAELILRFKSVK
jgi:outer membrane protein